MRNRYGTIEGARLRMTTKMFRLGNRGENALSALRPGSIGVVPYQAEAATALVGTRSFSLITRSIGPIDRLKGERGAD